MKAKTLTMEIVRNLGNYESLRVGGEWELEPEQDMRDASIRAWYELITSSDAVIIERRKMMEKPKEVQPSGGVEVAHDGRKVVTFSDPILQQIVKRVQATDTDLAKVEEFYKLDKDAREVVKAAIQLRDAPTPTKTDTKKRGNRGK